MTMYPAHPMRRALKRCPRVNERSSEFDSALAGSCGTLIFPQHLGHLPARPAFTKAVVALDPEAGRFCDDLLTGMESSAGSDLLGFVRTSLEHAAVQDHHDAEQRSVHGHHCRRRLRKIPELL